MKDERSFEERWEDSQKKLFNNLFTTSSILISVALFFFALSHSYFSNHANIVGWNSAFMLATFGVGMCSFTVSINIFFRIWRMEKPWKK